MRKGDGALWVLVGVTAFLIYKQQSNITVASIFGPNAIAQPDKGSSSNAPFELEEPKP